MNGQSQFGAERHFGFSMQALGLVVAAAVLLGMLAYQAYSFMLRELGAGQAGLVL